MKKNIIYTLLGSIAFIISCTDLDVEPKEIATPDDIFSEPSAYVSFHAKLYSGLVNTGQFGQGGSPDINAISDEGFSGYFRLYWQMQELPTDEAILGFENDGSVLELNRHSWSSTNAFTSGMFSRTSFQISQANQFLRESTEAILDARGIEGDVRQQIPLFRAEARFLRALSYWHSIDLFGDFPFADENSTVGELPPQVAKAEIFNFIESELLAIQDELAEPGQAPLGRADRAAAWMLLAKLYLNAPVYTGEDRSTDCITFCNRIIDSGVYSLAPEYRLNYVTDNNMFGEIIFPVVQEGLITESFGAVTTFVGHASQGGPTDNSGDLGIGGGWSGIRPLETFINLFPQDFSVDVRAAFDTTEVIDNETVGRNVRAQALTGGDFGENGWILVKFTNLSSIGVPGSDGEFLDTDFPMFRLADVYLMLAESVLLGGSGATRADALALVNELRERAYGDTSGNITDGELDLDFILDERGRELHWEMHRRQDLIRYDRFSTSGVWQFKGGSVDGSTTEAFRNLYPIPSSQIAAYNGGLTQNDGY